MIESILTISITALVAGFIFAMPIAGPISVLIVSNALGGRYRYSRMVSIGAATCDVFYVFIAIYGISRLYSYYKPVIPYLFLVGAVFFFFLAFKLFRSPVDIGSINPDTQLPETIKVKEKGGFYAGFMVNLLNPTLFISVLISSFFVISLAASLGFNTGGLAGRLDTNVKEMSSLETARIEEQMSSEKFKTLENFHGRKKHQETQGSPRFQVVLSMFYAFFVSLGGVLWFYLLIWLLERYRKLISVNVMSSLIKGFAVILFILAIFFVYSGINDLL